jgi:hypothetical protein
VNLDQNPTTLREQLVGSDAPGPYFSGNHHITLSNDEIVDVAIVASAMNAYYTWDLRVSYIYQDKQESVIVHHTGILVGDTDRNPFAVTGAAQRIGDYTVVYRLDTGNYPYRPIARDRYCEAGTYLHIAC